MITTFFFVTLPDWFDCLKLIRWKFMTEGGEIAYRVFRKTASLSEIEELIPSNKVESHLMFEENEIICDSPGKCVLFCYYKSIWHSHFMISSLFYLSDFIEFDNTFSYMKSKKVRYSIAVLPPTSVWEKVCLKHIFHSLQSVNLIFLHFNEVHNNNHIAISFWFWVLD